MEAKPRRVLSEAHRAALAAGRLKCAYEMVKRDRAEKRKVKKDDAPRKKKVKPD